MTASRRPQWLTRRGIVGLARGNGAVPGASGPSGVGTRSRSARTPAPYDAAATHSGRGDPAGDSIPQVLATILVEYPWATTVALVVLVLGCPPAGVWLASRPRVIRVLLGASVLAVLLLTLTPTDRERTGQCEFEWSFPTLGAVELMANVIMFVPVGFLTAMLLRQPVEALLAVSAGSGLIEIVQELLPGLGRSCSTNDWFCNTLGALLGVVLAAAALRYRRSRPEARGGRRRAHSGRRR